MLPHQTTHPDADQLNNYLAGRLSGDESRLVGDHLDDCPECCRQIESLGITSSLLAADGSSGPVPGANPSRTEFMVTGDEQPRDPEALDKTSRPDVSVRYEMFEQFAEGGMSVIYRARDIHLERDVALKVLGEGRHPETRLRRFRAEANVLGQLQHPGIPPVFDQGRLPDGRAFIAMKLIEGQTLAELLAQRASPRSELMHFLGVFKQICETVAFAHARGVIHRDLKPENIMVGAFGEVQVMDWGLSKRLPGAFERAAAESSAEFVGPDETLTLPTGAARTMAGAVIGTPAYMPPEQAGVRSRPIDERADVFSLGAILCEILTGQPPYTGESSSETFELARAAALDSAGERLQSCGADPRLIELARRCLSPDPADRVQSALEIAAEVEADFESIQERLRNVEVAHARQEEQRQRRRLQTVLVVVISLCVTMLTGGWAFVVHQNEVRHRRAVEEVSTALGEASQLREQALAHPLESTSHWSAAREAIHLAETIAAGTRDEGLRERVAELSSQIERETEAARRDRALVAQLTAADAPIALPNLPKLTADSEPPVPPAGRSRPFPPPPPHHPPSNQFGRPPARRPPPPEHRRDGDRRGPADDRHKEMQRILAEETSRRYVAALSGFELDPRAVSAVQAARLITSRPDDVRNDVTAALDAWLSVLCDPLSYQPQYREWVLEVLRGIDPDPDRTAIRALVGAADDQALYEVAHDEALLAQSPAFIVLVACRLKQPGDTIRLLREARARYPDSLLINQQLGEQLVRNRRGHEAVDAYMAALAIKPDAPTNVRAAMLLADHGRCDEAIAMYRNAIRIDPYCTDAYVRLANVLTVLDRAAEAIEVADDALARYTADDPDVWQLHVARGEACVQLQQPEEALEEYRRALSRATMPAADRADVQDRVMELSAGAGQSPTSGTP